MSWSHFARLTVIDTRDPTSFVYIASCNHLVTIPTSTVPDYLPICHALIMQPQAELDAAKKADWNAASDGGRRCWPQHAIDGLIMEYQERMGLVSVVRDFSTFSKRLSAKRGGSCLRSKKLSSWKRAFCLRMWASGIHVSGKDASVVLSTAPDANWATSDQEASCRLMSRCSDCGRS